MAQIGFGYGSEYQLLRYLGHHRQELEEIISKQIGEGKFEWEDFKYANPKKAISGDRELTGLDFLESKYPDKYKTVINEYKKFIKKEEWQKWDAIFTHKGTLYLVEAKAHIRELSSGAECHGGTSSERILKYFKFELPSLQVSEAWLRDYYQLANRLATSALLNKYGINTKILYIYFVNGYRKRVIDNDKVFETVNLNASEEQFRDAIKIEMQTLGITYESVSDLLAHPVFVNAEPIPYK